MIDFSILVNQMLYMLIVGVKLMSENFLDVEPDDNRFKNAKVILITADCSKSGVANPIDFIVNEGEGGHIE